MIDQLPQIGYAAAAATSAVLTVLAATVWRARYDGPALLFATISTTAWCAILAHSAATGVILPLPGFIAEVVVDIAWLNFVGSLFRGAITGRSFLVIRYGGVAIAAIVLLLGIIVELQPGLLRANLGSVIVTGSIITSIAGLVLLEQVMRNGRVSQRRDLRYLVLGLASLFFIDLVLYSDAVLVGAISTIFWDMRGFIVAMAALLVCRALALRDRRAPGVFVSRRVVFHMATIVFAGVFLTVVGLAAQLVRYYDQQWGDAAQLVLFFGAAVVFVLFILSDRYRNKLRVLVTKHFFEAKYDYREEWRRLITTLTAPELELPLAKRAVRAILDIVDSDAGVLWVRQPTGTFEALSSWNTPLPESSPPASQTLLAFVDRTRWIVDLDELRDSPGHYKGMDPRDIPPEFDDAWALVPLVHNDAVCGLVTMAHSSTTSRLNFEDYDLLKTAGRQVASYLEQERATTRLAESMQFEAFSRLTAYLMHDLKNTMAQQQLIVDNAEKHRRNPDFVDDAIDTIRRSTERIRNVINQLQQGSRGSRHENVDVVKIVLKATSRTEHRQPVPRTRILADRAMVVGDEERLLMALCHAIGNAQDATPDDGTIDVDVSIDGESCVVQISDSGAGMDTEFVRNRLFKPFDSTKGAQGMGIGAHQIRETVREMGGDIAVHSEPGHGTTFALRMPLAAEHNDRDK